MPQILVRPTGQIRPSLEVRLQSVVKLADIRRDKLRGSAQLYAGKFDRKLVTNGLAVNKNQHKGGRRSEMDTGQLLQVIAIAIGSLALGMRIGRLLTLWEEKTKNRDYESDESRY